MAEPCPQVVKRQSHSSSESGGQQQSKRVNKAILSESGEETFLEVVIGSGDSKVVSNVSEDIGLETVPSLSCSFELVEGLKGTF